MVSREFTFAARPTVGEREVDLEFFRLATTGRLEKMVQGSGPARRRTQEDCGVLRVGVLGEEMLERTGDYLRELFIRGVEQGQEVQGYTRADLPVERSRYHCPTSSWTPWRVP